MRPPICEHCEKAANGVCDSDASMLEECREARRMQELFAKEMEPINAGLDAIKWVKENFPPEASK